MQTHGADWKRRFRRWKLECAAVLIFLLCGHAAVHIEVQLPIYDSPTTIAPFHDNGSNVAAHVSSWRSDGSRWGGA
jgi:hypothetical protein